MRIQKLLALGAAAVLSSACFALPAFAHGHHGRAQAYTSCPAVCTIDSCTEIGRHTHDGVTYCGYNHSSGYCDGSCVTTTNYGGHHGCCH